MNYRTKTTSGNHHCTSRIKQEHLDYLSVLESEGKDIDNPTYLMQAFSVTERHARIIIQHWQNSVTEKQDAMFDAGIGYGG